jgi:5-methylcytosine-specific restriction endonuclease McrA
MRAIDGMKRCSRCGETKVVADFGKGTSMPDGLRNWCKVCVNASGRAFRETYPERVHAGQRAYHIANASKVAGDRKRRYDERSEAHREHDLEIHRVWVAAHPDSVKKAQKTYRDTHVEVRQSYNQAHIEEKRAWGKAWLSDHKEQHAKTTSAWRARNKDRTSETNKAWTEANKERKADMNRAWRLANPDVQTEYKRNRRARETAGGGVVTAPEWRALLTAYGNRCLSCGATSNLELDHVKPLAAGGANTIYNAQPLCRTCNASKATKTVDYRAADNYADWL